MLIEYLIDNNDYFTISFINDNGYDVDFRYNSFCDKLFKYSNNRITPIVNYLNESGINLNKNENN